MHLCDDCGLPKQWIWIHRINKQFASESIQSILNSSRIKKMNFDRIHWGFDDEPSSVLSDYELTMFRHYERYSKEYMLIYACPYHK